MLASVVVVMRQKSDQGSCAMTMLNASSDQMLFAPKYAKRRTAANPIINHSTIGATEPSDLKSDQGSCAMTMLNASSDQMLFAPKYAKRRTAANPIINHSTIGATEP